MSRTLPTRWVVSNGLVMGMPDDELTRILADTAKRVRVHCDEYHAHSAQRGCVSGDERDVLICRLVEALQAERAAAREFVAQLGKV